MFEKFADGLPGSATIALWILDDHSEQFQDTEFHVTNLTFSPTGIRMELLNISSEVKYRLLVVVTLPQAIVYGCINAADGVGAHHDFLEGSEKGAFKFQAKRKVSFALGGYEDLRTDLPVAKIGSKLIRQPF
jgi:hypothetical protein